MGRSTIPPLLLEDSDAHSLQLLLLHLFVLLPLSLSSCSSSCSYSRDRKLTRLLCESLGNINCHTTMIFHVSDSASSYMETLTTIQLASRIHRTRNKSKVGLVSPPHPSPIDPHRRSTQNPLLWSCDFLKIISIYFVILSLIKLINLLQFCYSHLLFI